jgi:hypothetical protein
LLAEQVEPALGDKNFRKNAQKPSSSQAKN